MLEMFRVIRLKIQRACWYYKKDGLWKTLLLSWDHIGIFKYRLLIFFELDIDKAITWEKRSQTLELITLTQKTVDEIEEYWDGWFFKDQALKRLEQGRVLLITKKGSKMTFYQWLEFMKVDIPYLDLSFQIPDDTVCMAYIYTVPEYRGKGIASNAKPLVLDYLRTQGFRKIILTIAPENLASQKVNKKAGFQAYQRVRYFKIFCLRFYWVKDEEKQRKKVFWFLKNNNSAIWKTFSKLQGSKLL
ncbi:MAG: GNAT family N-acetyltransferase [bacterium]|nr:GNAT family N-acetyltransferase [bacterium]